MASRASAFSSPSNSAMTASLSRVSCSSSSATRARASSDSFAADRALLSPALVSPVALRILSWGTGLPGREQRVGLFQRGERVVVPVHVDHVQVLASLIPCPLTDQVEGTSSTPALTAAASRRPPSMTR